jgi:hypothetical protein
MLSSLGLGFVGLCLVPSRSFERVGGQRVVRGALLCGRWSLIVYCGAFGGKEMIDVLRVRRGHERSSSIFFLSLFFLGLQVGLPHGLLAL